jgi:sRNA-binding regulator protein Hfq
MVVTFEEALKKQKNKESRIRLVNGEILHGTVQSVTSQIIEVKMPDQGAGSPVYTVPVTAILYVSDCEIPMGSAPNKYVENFQV